MPLDIRIVLSARTIFTVRFIGLLLFVVAFQMPACHDFWGNVYPGWKCAQMALGATVAPEAYNWWDVLAVVSGFINPFVVLTFLLSFTNRLGGLKIVLFLATLLCIASTWVFFVGGHMTPLVGHFFWIAGALVISFSSAFLLEENFSN